jgi:predicted TIM-barrel fold metal-dependent hydrolase
MIIDSHAHIFPYLGGKSGYGSVDEHLLVCQKAMHEHLSQPPRRIKDNVIIKEKKLWDPRDPSFKGRKNVNFRVGQFGRFEWTQDGVDCYIQYLPPTLRDMTCPPDLLKAMMDYVGIDMAVLQCGDVYGKLNYYYAMVLDEHPELANVFIPLARVNETEAYKDEQIKRLRHVIEDLGLKGLWFAANNTSFGPNYRIFWDEVRELKIPVFLAFYPEKEAWVASLKSLEKWIELYSDIPCVLPQAFPLSTIRYDDELIIPDFAEKIIKEGNFYLELTYPIARGGIEDYPFPISRKAVQKLYDTFGAEKLVWGSDVPMVERYCTYSQSLKYLRDYCEFISPNEMELILGKNLAKVFNL